MTDGDIPRPHSTRLDPSREDYDLILQRHDDAVRDGSVLYQDPTTGLAVFTAVFLRDRGTCCHSGCRHCPYL